MRILIIEDDKSISSALKDGLENLSFAVDLAEDGEQGRRLAMLNDYDCIVTDYNLPGMDGRMICSSLREGGRNTPIIMLTVRDATSDKVAALDSGADDYLTKPFSFDELTARIRALMRRPAEVMENVLSSQGVTLNPALQTVIRDNREIILTRKEFMLLEYLMRNADRILTRSAIMEHVWDSEGDPFSNTIETHILNLRKKLDANGGQKLIQTYPGRGYRFGA